MFLNSPLFNRAHLKSVYMAVSVCLSLYVCLWSLPISIYVFLSVYSSVSALSLSFLSPSHSLILHLWLFRPSVHRLCRPLFSFISRSPSITVFLSFHHPLPVYFPRPYNCLSVNASRQQEPIIYVTRHSVSYGLPVFIFLHDNVVTGCPSVTE